MTAIPKLIGDAEAKRRFNLDQYGPFGDIGFDKVILLDGDTYINGDLNQDWTENTLTTLGAGSETDCTLILVNGNLTVAGTISPASVCYPFLLVLGNVTCDVLHSNDEFIHITGDAEITYAFKGEYNDGSIVIDGITRVPYVLNSEHSSSITPQGAILINYFGDYDDDFFEYDYTKKDLGSVMVSAVFDAKKDFSPFAFIELLKAGESPLKKGARPARLILEEELEQLGKGNSNIHALDLTGRKLKEFPHTLTKLALLKKLVLNENPIGSIPANIKDLVSLEELHLERCGLKTLPSEIGLLKNLKVLNVAYNSELVLPESINQLTSLRVLNISYNVGFGLPASLTGLKDLEELNCYKCTTAAPIEFPEVLTQLTGLKRLLMGNNSFKTLPASITELQNLEELNLDAGLCYLNELPDLSKLKRLKILHANGLISFARPIAKQSLLRSFFQITSLETLYIDRHGERNAQFIEMNEFKEIEQNLSHDPERFAAFVSKLSIVTNKVHGEGRKGLLQEGLKAEHLEGISNLQNLKVLDLSLNGLTSLPEEVFTLKGLQFLNLQYNRLPTSERLTISKNLPGCTIDFRDNRAEKEATDREDVKQWQAMNTLMNEASMLRCAKHDRGKLLQSLVVYDEVLAFFSSGKVVDEYNLLNANYGKVYAYSYLTSSHKASFSPVELPELIHAAIKQGLHTLDLIPSTIWHFSDLGKFHEEITRITANSVALLMHVISDKQEDLERALEIILKGIAFIENESHYFIYDTQVRILLKLGRTEEAYQLVKSTLALLPDFSDFQDIKNDTGYKNWLENNSEN